MSMSVVEMLVRNGYVQAKCMSKQNNNIMTTDVGTVVANLAHYGYGLDMFGLEMLANMSRSELIHFWDKTKPALATITGASKHKDMNAGIVYSNFPDEVIQKSELEYWLPQILMYCGFPKEFFAEKTVARPAKTEKLSLKILKLAPHDVFEKIAAGLFVNSSKWNLLQKNTIDICAAEVGLSNFDVHSIVFKENLIDFLKDQFKAGRYPNIKTATDVLRIAAAVCGGDVSLKTKTKFVFARPVRRVLLGYLEQCKNLADDAARRPEDFKRLFKQLHAGDYKQQFPNVLAVADQAYNDALPKTFASQVNRAVLKNDSSILSLLESRPGEYVRVLRVIANTFGLPVIASFTKILSKLDTLQLLKLRNYLDTFNAKNYFAFPPGGNWNKLKHGEDDRIMDDRVAAPISEAITVEVARRVAKVGRFNLGKNLEYVALKTTETEVADLARGTKIAIPDDVKFVRSASYWKSPGSTVWYDNGWNTFDENWNPQWTICWNANVKKTTNKGIIQAAFSGDPLSSKDSQGRACQVIDLYLDGLKADGIRYAVWNILAFSNIPFSDCEVYGDIQMGEDASKGKIFDAARSVMHFPIKGKNKTKQLVVLDVNERTLQYIDLNLKGAVNSAASNEATLAKVLPAVWETMANIPTWADLFRGTTSDPSGIVVSYSDDVVSPMTKEALVFRQENPNTSYAPFSLDKLLTEK